jgi:hypothetical protein
MSLAPSTHHTHHALREELQQLESRLVETYMPFFDTLPIERNSGHAHPGECEAC